MRSHNANSLQSQKFRIMKYGHRLYSQKDETEITPKINVLKSKMFGNKMSCSIIQQNSVRYEGDG